MTNVVHFPTRATSIDSARAAHPSTYGRDTEPDDEPGERDEFSLAFTPWEWSLLLTTLEKSQYAAVQQLGDDVRRQLREQTP